eukprot:CAMPEP_0182448326 /NCGR_PEP_ID=MMETSP1172-20130603/25962_1 /TAXON_ID=708627 /ORGANISM="Timspurckia oligopyrenoides, Strain CCMP3278" /LENGTH=211 /DNA_ID=CAMNT_0024645147 /DNA_START=48 /DNA_END=679 /DNA_ORIENTATION=+
MKAERERIISEALRLNSVIERLRSRDEAEVGDHARRVNLELRSCIHQLNAISAWTVAQHTQGNDRHAFLASTWCLKNGISALSGALHMLSKDGSASDSLLMPTLHSIAALLRTVRRETAVQLAGPSATLLPALMRTLSYIESLGNSLILNPAHILSASLAADAAASLAAGGAYCATYVVQSTIVTSCLHIIKLIQPGIKQLRAQCCLQNTS